MPDNRSDKMKGQKKNYQVIEETGGRGGKESYGEEPPCCACDRKRCLNGRCGVCWLPILGLSIAVGICAVLVFTGVLGFSFETSGNETLYEEICDSCTDAPTSDPTAAPTVEPTSAPTVEPTSMPSYDPTSTPTGEPTVEPSGVPSVEPTKAPTGEPTVEPTGVPTVEPSSAPTSPTYEPTSAPTGEPTVEPSSAPTSPTEEPTAAPTAEPTSERRMYNPDRTPNVLFIIADGAGFGDAQFETPEVDEFLEEGYTFKNLRPQFSRGSLMTGKSASIGAVEPCDEAHLKADSVTWAEQLRSKGYNNYYYGNWMLGADSWQSTPLGRGWDFFYGALNHPYGLERGDGGSWIKLTGKCLAQPVKTLNTKTYSHCLASCYEFEAATFHDEDSSCLCFSDASRCVDLSDDVVYKKLSQKNTVIDWWRNKDAANPKLGVTGDDLIIEEVQSHLRSLEDEMWSMTVSLTKPDSYTGFAPHGTNTAVYDACSRYFQEGGVDFDYDHGVSCQWSKEYDEKVGQVLETLKSTELWEHTIVVLVSAGNVFSIGGGALPAKFLSRTNEDLHSMVDVVPTIMAVAGFSDAELVDAKLDGFAVIDINQASAKIHKNKDVNAEEASINEPSKADLTKCGSESSYTSAHGFKYNAPWVNSKIVTKK